MNDLFPFENPRPQQEDLIPEIEDTIDSNENITIHAPTGIGKTAAALTPAIEKIREKGEGKVFFLTPRHSQHEIALETVRKINKKHGENIKTADLIGKSHLCDAPPTSTREGSSPCPRKEDTFKDNGQLSNKTIKQINKLKNQNLSAEKVKQKTNNVCPYQVTLGLCKEADVIIADYFHIFHSGIREILLENAGTSLEDSIIIVDEAHNLDSRVRGLLSYTINEQNIKQATTEADKFGYYQEQEHLERLESTFRQLAREKLGQETHEEKIDKKELIDPINNFHSFKELIIELEAIGEEVMEEQERSHCEELATKLEKWEGPDEKYSRVIKRERTNGNRQIKIKYNCLDPQITTKEPLKNSRASILMSATLKPQEMYINLLGLEENKTRKLEFESPFPQENRLDVLVPTLTTKYSERDESTFQKYAWIINKSIENIPGNSAIFSPSYKIQQEIVENLRDKTDSKIYIEKRNNSKEEKQELIEEFKSHENNKKGKAILAGVTAGSYGEGIDLPGKQLEAVFIIGIPLKRPNLENKELINYLDDKFGEGWNYGYNYPAINKTVQAAGRCIRSKEDRGAIIFMDKRYSWSNYRKPIPNHIKFQRSKAPWKELQEFF